MAELIIAGETFNVVVEGDENAPVLMLSNSLGTNLHMWDKQMPALTERFRVLRYDTRGHGSSVVTEGPYTIAELGQDAVAIMDALGFAKVHWLGLSMGGMIGQWLLTHVPDRIDRAVLANTGAQLGSPEFWNERIAVASDKGMAALAPSVIERWFTKEFRDHHPGETEAIRAVLEATSPVGYAGCCAAIRDMDLLAALPSVTAPVLVIAGRQDPATPPGLGALIASAIPGAKLVTLDTAHLSNLEDPARFNREVIDFLTGEAASGVEEEAAAAPKKPRRKPAAKKPEPAMAAPEEKEAAAEPAPPVEIADEAEPDTPAAPAAPRRRAPAKKAAAKKAAAKKAPAKKTPAKKAAVKKAAAKKAAAKKAPARKAAAKKSPAKKAPAKKTAAGRTAGRGTAAKRATAKKAAARKVAAPRKAAAKKSARKAAPRKAVAKRAAVKKTAVKKTPVKKTAAKKAVKKTAAKKTTRRPVGRRGPARRR